MKRVATAAASSSSARECELSIPDPSRLRPGSPFFEGMKGRIVGPDPDDNKRTLVMCAGDRISWPTAHVREV